jgi:hypothetical protein
MHGKIRILVLLSVVVLSGGCSALRKRPASPAAALPAGMDYYALVNAVENSNITGKGFIIRKGRIELEGTEFDGSYGFNARMNNEGDFLASVRGPLGIELIRLIISGDDICLIDRLGKIAYIGKKSAYIEKNGLPGDLLKSIFGDIAVSTPWQGDTITERGLVIKEENENYTRETLICIEEMKVCSERYSLSRANAGIMFNYDEFRLSEGNKYASEIVIREGMRNLLIRIRLDDVVIGYEGDIPLTIPPYTRRTI